MLVTEGGLLVPVYTSNPGLGVAPQLARVIGEAWLPQLLPLLDDYPCLAKLVTDGEGHTATEAYLLIRKYIETVGIDEAEAEVVNRGSFLAHLAEHVAELPNGPIVTACPELALV